MKSGRHLTMLNLSRYGYCKAVRFDDEQDCYGWNNEGYSHNWRNQDYKLPKGRYLVEVVISSSGQECSGIYRIVNDVDNRTDFRMEAALPEDRNKLAQCRNKKR